MKESSILRSIRARMGQLRILVLRYQVGTFIAPDGSVVHIGEKGVSDLIGIVPHTVTQEDVGKTLGVFTALEVKDAKGKLRREQGPFLNRINELGGLGAVVRSDADAEDVVKNKWKSKFVVDYKKTGE